jgi:hypothetical protein
MGFAERFPQAAKAIRLISATLVPGFALIFAIALFIPMAQSSADIGELQRFALDRVLYVGLVAVMALGIGALCGEVAYPHSSRIPAFLGALTPAVLGVVGLVDEFRRNGTLELGWFLLLFVVPASYVLGALWRQSRRRKKEAAVEP